MIASQISYIGKLQCFKYQMKTKGLFTFYFTQHNMFIQDVLYGLLHITK